jgi:hypothetical protein
VTWCDSRAAQKFQERRQISPVHDRVGHDQRRQNGGTEQQDAHGPTANPETLDNELVECDAQQRTTRRSADSTVTHELRCGDHGRRRSVSKATPNTRIEKTIPAAA